MTFNRDEILEIVSGNRSYSSNSVELKHVETSREYMNTSNDLGKTAGRELRR